jgi:hypothetical protein
MKKKQKPEKIYIRTLQMVCSHEHKEIKNHDRPRRDVLFNKIFVLF